tara:strand:+ start:574 stop:1224 length:651 start_codon:yes stop_codon:yes gene_type:complete
MSIVLKNYNNLILNINQKYDSKKINIIAVSKTFSLEYIKPLIDAGHIHFGENKVQEALDKWTEVKKKNNKIKLHMIGKLQRNKVKKSLQLFDYIHSLDNIKLADTIAKEEEKLNRKLKYFIQVNVGAEEQKSGVSLSNASEFVYYCVEKLKLDVIGLMALPPQSSDPTKYFKIVSDLNNKLKFKDLSLGMSADYIDAIKYNSNFIRVGSTIFGNRS